MDMSADALIDLFAIILPYIPWVFGAFLLLKFGKACWERDVFWAGIYFVVAFLALVVGILGMVM